MKTLEYNDRIKSIRISKGWSLRKLATEVGVAHNTVAKWEASPYGKQGSYSKPSRLNLLKIAELFNVEPGWLFFGDERNTSRSQQIASNLEMLTETEKDQIEGMIQLLIGNKKGSSKNGKTN